MILSLAFTNSAYTYCSLKKWKRWTQSFGIIQSLQAIRDVIGMGYNSVNIVIFFILQPALIIFCSRESRYIKLKK